jgi:hypothetical protein
MGTSDGARQPRLREWLKADPDLALRFARVRSFSHTVHASEYHLTNACNLRCKGCWFFVNDFDKATSEVGDLAALRSFVQRERERGVNAALLIGGEPTLVPNRVSVYVEEMTYVNISTNGLRPLPREGFENVTVAVTLFGGGPLDDELRGIRPNGSSFSGLFEQALGNYRGDPRTIFIFALTESGIKHIEPTVARIADNGNLVTFNFYSAYGTHDPVRLDQGHALLDEALRVRELYPDTVTSHPYYISTMITGKSHWDSFSYDVCPSISVAHPGHAVRRRNGNPTLPGFNAWAADLQTVEFCCTSGRCAECRDSQAVLSWLLVSARKFFDSPEHLRWWVEIAESYWRQLYWSPFHPARLRGDLVAAAGSAP